MDMEELILDLIDYNVEDEFDEDEEEGTWWRKMRSCANC